MNFSFLQDLNGMAMLYDCCAQAENFAIEYPNISLAQSRKAMEFTVKLMYTSLVGKTAEMTVYDILSDPTFLAAVQNNTLIERCHSIRKLGNKSLHDEGIMTKTEAMDAVAALHTVVGMGCVLLGLIRSYPAFCASFREKAVQPTEHVEMAAAVSAKLDALMFSNFSGIRVPKKPVQLIDMHEQMAKIRANAEMPRLDTAANSRNAFQLFVQRLSSRVPSDTLMINYPKQLVCSNQDGETKTIALKSGCPPLGKKDASGNWVMLQGIDYVVYAPELLPDMDIDEQLHVFTREEFLKMWEDLGLIRYKVSSAVTKQNKLLYGEDFKSTIADHADVVSVQSFLNSGKKRVAVPQYCAKFPTLANGGYARLLKA